MLDGPPGRGQISPARALFFASIPMIRIPFSRLLLACALTLQFAPACTAAQAMDSARVAADSSTVAGWLRQLCPGQRVMVATAYRERVAGRCVSLGDERLVLRQEGGERDLPPAGMDTVWARGPARRGAMITGAVITGSLSALLGAFAAAVLCEYRCESTIVQWSVGGGAAGAFTGALLGAAAGTGRTVWVRVYPRR
jgi:hypothetical protein